jgi:hypothetical protein
MEALEVTFLTLMRAMRRTRRGQRNAVREIGPIISSKRPCSCKPLVRNVYDQVRGCAVDEGDEDSTEAASLKNASFTQVWASEKRSHSAESSPEVFKKSEAGPAPGSDKKPE